MGAGEGWGRSLRGTAKRGLGQSLRGPTSASVTHRAGREERNRAPAAGPRVPFPPWDHRPPCQALLPPWVTRPALPELHLLPLPAQPGLPTPGMGATSSQGATRLVARGLGQGRGNPVSGASGSLVSGLGEGPRASGSPERSHTAGGCPGPGSPAPCGSKYCHCSSWQSW